MSRDDRRPSRGVRRWLAGGVAVTALVGVLAGCSGGGSSQTSDSDGTSTGGSTTRVLTSAADLQSAYEKVVQQVLPSVVQIRTDHALGSGVVYDSKGNIVTNAHVVGDAKKFQVLLATNSKPLPATLVGAYPPNDLAVIHVQGAEHLRPADFGDSSKLKVGQMVLAMGSPLGLQGSVTNGIVSAVGRTVTEPQGQGSPGATLPNVVQTSAAINPGNSGGALVDLSGNVVGIPTLAAVDQEIGGTAPGIGFAIPSSVATNIAGQLVEQGRVTRSNRAALGVGVQTVADLSGQPVGVGIVRVERGGAAQRAGLQPGDIITAIDGHKTPTTQALSTVLTRYKPGDTVRVSVTHPDGSSDTVQVTLGQLTG